MLAKDIIGKKYGRLTVVKLLEERGNRNEFKINGKRSQSIQM